MSSGAESTPGAHQPPGPCARDCAVVLHPLPRDPGADVALPLLQKAFAAGRQVVHQLRRAHAQTLWIDQVQVGAFADAAAATALRDKLRSAGFNTFTDSVNTEGGMRTRVRVGPVVNRAEADALNASVKAKAGVSGMVRSHP